ncbi:MAG: carboxylating nicotinate-nucleotide diphosphorylase [Candidatus Methanofastidiosa archaeon]|nr:carboxylating nicotinate-nucleotide diphosphorylase [Candidatus Methanofastidiosa archaeon]
MRIDFLRQLLRADIGYGDITSSLLPDRVVKGEILAKEDLVLSGTAQITPLLSEYGVECNAYFNDGDHVSSGLVIMALKGNVKTLLTLERTVLNILQRMSGIATVTAECVKAVGPSVRVAATRKTLLPYFDKMAVIDGGGDPHRWRLDDMFLIKDNHIELLGIRAAVDKARKMSFSKKIEVEVASMEQALEAAEAGADIIMLDNMRPSDIKATIKALKRAGHDKIMFEASGNITPLNLKEYASSGVNIVSMGWLTHSVRSVDISLEVHGD